MLKFFRLPFATTGDKTAVPDAVDSNGNVSYSQGYGFDYQRQKTDPAAKNIERDKMNQIFFDVTTAVAELQANGIPDFITTALNGGAAYSYAQYAVVKYSGDLYISLVAANTALPSDATKWALLPTPALLQQSAYMSAAGAGTVDDITAAFTPAIAALPAAPNTLSLMVRAGGANTSTTPTFAPDGLAAKTIVKGANQALAAGDIAGAGHWLHLDYDPTLDKWVLQNPATGLTATIRGFQVFTASGTFTVPAGVTEVIAEVWGGGGGGGGGTSTANGGSGGGGGGYALKRVTGLTPGGTVSVTVGAGGTSGAYGLGGGAGGSSSFGAYCSATGGAGGLCTGTATSGVDGGVGTGGDINLKGDPSNPAESTAPSPGGMAPRGGGGGLGGYGASGSNGGLPGGGGGGGDSPSPNAGGTGGGGMVYVRWGL